MSKGVTGQEGKTTRSFNEFIRKPESYSSIDLAEVKFFRGSEENFIKAIQNAKKLSSIKISGCDVGQDLIKQILFIYSSPEDISSNHVIEGIMANGSYDKSGGRLGLSCGSTVRAPLRSLDLQNNGLEDQEIDVIADFLKTNTFLTNINLSGNNITDKGATPIIEALQAREEVVTLHLDDKKFNQATIKAFREAAGDVHNIYLGERQIAATGNVYDFDTGYSSNEEDQSGDVKLGGDEEGLFEMDI